MKARLMRTIAAVLLVGGCAAPVQKPSGFLTDYSLLKPSSFENVLLYRAPDFDPRQYGLVRVSQARYFGDSPRWNELSPQAQKEILSYVDTELAQRMKARGESTDARRILGVRAAITDVESPNRGLNVATSLLIGPVTRGGAALEIEVKDVSTDRVMLAATCAERGHPITDVLDAYSVLGHARVAVAECIKRFEKAYAEATPK